MRPLEGNPTFTNPLAQSSSPYLRQHAHNPVYWLPWGKEAIDKAREENKPILLSIGYSSCYWCHVMEREVFDNVSIAAQMNRWFINVKVDREEMPEIDDIYMVARQMMTRQGGWPNNVFLTPSLKPFYAVGTAPVGDSNGQPGWPRILEWVNYVWQTQQDEIEKAAEEITQNMRTFLLPVSTEAAGRENMRTQAEKLYTYLRERHDDRSGGFFQAPKFPHESYLSFLLDYYAHTGDAQALGMVNFTLGKMAAGGINDHVGCGFHRYAVDKEWYVPHFEKMLYNQAQLANVFTEAYRHTEEPYFSDVARSILEFVSGPFTSPDGLFYAAFDAEVRGIEGDYYSWTAEELQSVLTEQEIAFFTMFFALADIPHFPGHPAPTGQVIIARQPLHEAAKEKGMPYVQLMAFVGLVMNKLLAVRNRRESPRRDDKAIVSWNGMMIEAYARGARVFNQPNFTDIARKAALFILHRVTDLNGNLQRIWIDGKAVEKARLEDYAMLMRGVLELHRTTGEAEWLHHARDLLKLADAKLLDSQGEGWFATEPDEYLLVRMKTADDSAIPSANATMLHNLIDLYEFTGEEDFLVRAKKVAEYFSGQVHRILVESAVMLSAFLRLDALNKGERKPVAAIKPSAVPVLGEAAEKVTMLASLYPAAAKAGELCELIVTLTIEEGWNIQAANLIHGFAIPTVLDVRGPGVEKIIDIQYPTPVLKVAPTPDEYSPVYEGVATITVRLKLSEKYRAGEDTIHAELRFQPCREMVCLAVADKVISV